MIDYWIKTLEKSLNLDKQSRRTKETILRRHKKIINRTEDTSKNLINHLIMIYLSSYPVGSRLNFNWLSIIVSHVQYISSD